MGVPKFYRWISERYPCLSQVIKENQIPEFDNLYLDMNGIIHVCSHPNDDDPHFRITEEKIFSDIFHYIEVLFRIIRPKRNFFMAVDGVAPRAKMNQQRGRRFRSAKEAEANVRRAIQKGEVLPKEERFDSNCITPGTQFMVRLHEQLKYFVNKKISSDPQWQSCTVYLSGHNVPGEGEHKIMDFIRYMKSKKDYDPNTRHCLYGLDADLIMLGLVSHEPHFSLLREEIRFGKQANRMTKPEQTTWHLLHLSLMREYLDFEFQSLRDKLQFPYDLEKIIDDWVLMGFLVGNDFVPHLPHLHINKDALPLLHKTYIETLPELDGYLHDGGIINLQRMEVYLKAVRKFENEQFQDIYDDLKWLEGKVSNVSCEDASASTPSRKKFTDIIKENHKESPRSNNPYMALADVSDAFDDSLFMSPDKRDQSSSHEGVLNGDLVLSDDEKESFEMEFKQHRREYYREKFGLEIVDDDFVNQLALEYMRALQWILHYYYNGVQSWSWYFPYHYSPYLSDINKISTMDLQFDPGAPFRPFEQLLAVLPSASKNFLPLPFQSLMISEASPIIDYYPVNFKTDLNGKQQEWEAVVLIPFIDENRLWSAMKQLYPKLSKEEKDRNSFGFCLKYEFSRDQRSSYPSSLPGVFEDINLCRAKCETIGKEAFRLDKGVIRKGLCEGVKQDVYFPGFPTFKHITHTAYLKKCGVRVFQQNSRKENTIISVQSSEFKSIQSLANEMVGQTVYVEWPYLVEATVVCLWTDTHKYERSSSGDTKETSLDQAMVDNLKTKRNQILKYHMERRGIEIGKIDIVVDAKPLKGKRYRYLSKGDVALEKEWSMEPISYAYQTIVKNPSVHASVHNKVCESVSELYPVGCECFMMGSPHYGCCGEVLGMDVKSGRIRLELKVPEEPDFKEIIKGQESIMGNYMSSDKVAKMIGISTLLLSRITSSVIVERKDRRGENGSTANLGLKLKYSSSKREAIGYTRFQDNRWNFSPLAVNLVKTYHMKFPAVFKALGSSSSQERYYEDEIFKGKPNVLTEVLEWLKSLPSHKISTVKCGSIALEDPVVQDIEASVVALKENQRRKNVIVKVKPYVLFRPMEDFGELVPDPHVDFYLFDRIVNVRNSGSVPYGLRGTIIGIHRVGDEDGVATENEGDLKFEIAFDESFLGGLSIRGMKGKVYYLSDSSLLNISYGERKEMIKKGKSPLEAAYEQGKTPMQTTTKTPQQSPSSSWRRNNSRDDYSPYSPSGGYKNEKYSDVYSGHRRNDGPAQSTPRSRYSNSPHGNSSEGRNRSEFRNVSQHDEGNKNQGRRTAESDTWRTPQKEKVSSSETTRKFKGIDFVKAQYPDRNTSNKTDAEKISKPFASTENSIPKGKTTPDRKTTPSKQHGHIQGDVASRFLPNYVDSQPNNSSPHGIDVEKTAILQSYLNIQHKKQPVDPHQMSDIDVAKALRPNLPHPSQRPHRPYQPSPPAQFMVANPQMGMMQGNQGLRGPPPSGAFQNWGTNAFAPHMYNYPPAPQGFGFVPVGPFPGFDGGRGRNQDYQAQVPMGQPPFGFFHQPGMTINPSTRFPVGVMPPFGGPMPGIVPNLSPSQRPEIFMAQHDGRSPRVISPRSQGNQRSPTVSNFFIPSQVERVSRTPGKKSEDSREIRTAYPENSHAEDEDDVIGKGEVEKVPVDTLIDFSEDDKPGMPYHAEEDSSGATQASADSKNHRDGVLKEPLQETVNVLNLLGSTDGKQDSKTGKGTSKKIAFAPIFHGSTK